VSRDGHATRGRGDPLTGILGIGHRAGEKLRKGGYKIIRICTMIKGMSQGMVARISRCISTPWLLETTNRIMPMGGVSVPIIRVKMMLTPR
jgi:hypothetical protein